MERGGMEQFPMIALKDNLHEASSWLETAISQLASDGLTQEELEAYYTARPEMKRLELQLAAIREQLEALWTPAMRVQLAREEGAYQDLADRHDAQSY